MKTVRCLVLQNDGSQQVECRLFLEQGIVVADPPDSPTAQMILGGKIVGPDEWIRIAWQIDAEDVVYA